MIASGSMRTTRSLPAPSTSLSRSATIWRSVPASGWLSLRRTLRFEASKARTSPSGPFRVTLTSSSDWLRTATFASRTVTSSGTAYVPEKLMMFWMK